MMIVDNYIFFVWKPRICLLGALKYFGVRKKSYMASIIERIYDHYCRGAHSTYLTYLRCYRKEFSSYEDFLQRKFNLFPNEISEIGSKFLFHKDIKFQPENNITNLLEDDKMNKAFKCYLGGEVNED